SDRDGAFYNADFEITPKIVGHGSPYHTASGTHATCALIARAAGNLPEQVEATSEFIKAAARPVTGLDLTFGKSGIVMGSAILLDAAFGLPGDWTALREFGDASVSDLWNVLDSKPGVEDADIDHLGIAHGWAGFLYATLQWHRISNSDIPGGVFQRLDELSALAMPAGRGVEWPWVIHAAGDPATMAGWCNGSCGQVFLWSLAHDLFGDSRWLAMAEKAAWNSWESNDASASLCCGLVGRAYALLNFFRHSGDPLWLDRARTLAHRAATNGRMPSEHQHSLYKGEFGLAVLAADLEAPDEAVMPFFEPFGYSSSAK
ncbi:MAG: hypothetical protein M3Q09_09915, partial [Gemmatimonadota bacterium]|nr:hypothetical protein [Gemmatimonadota bacterium]